MCRVHKGHEPPGEDGSAMNAWLPGYWARYAALLTQFNASVQGQFFGHVHTDFWTVRVRGCLHTYLVLQPV